MSATPAEIRIQYDFEFEGGARRTYDMRFDGKTMRMVPGEPSPDGLKDWTRLGFHQCANCPLKEKTSPACPIARNLKSVAEHFKADISHHAAIVSVHTRERTYSKKTDLQQGLQSIFGLIMATSGCPHMDFLKVMARYHLPFSTFEETIVRSLSLYLLTQFFQAYKGQEPDYKLDQLKTRYEAVSRVNEGILSRLRSLGGKDADKNALVILDAFATLIPKELNSDPLELAKMILPGMD